MKSDFTEHNKFVIPFLSKVGLNNNLELLVDTGASCSMLKIDNINPETYINTKDRIFIGGAFGGNKLTYGSIETNLEIGNNLLKLCKFHIIENTDTIPGDGILGVDFLQNSVVMDCVDHKMYCFDEKENCLIEISNEFGHNKATVENIAPWNKYNKGIGLKLLLQQGYKIGKGLGVYSQGIQYPISESVPNCQIKNNAKNQLNFINETSDHINSLMSIQFESETPTIRKNYHEYQEKDYYITIPPRMEVITNVRIKEKGKRVCLATQIQEGILTSNTIVKSDNGYAKIGIINSTEKMVVLSNFTPKTIPFTNFEIIQQENKFRTSIDIRQARYSKLIEILKFESTNDKEKDAIKEMCWKYNDIFHLPDDKLTHTNVTEFKLPLLDNSKIVNRKQYRIPEKHRLELKNQIQKLQEEDIIENSISPFNSPVILVPKKGLDADGNKKFRMCVDYRQLNNVCIPFSFPLPRIEDIIDQLGNSTYFSTLDLSQGFHQVLITKEDREKTAFSSDYGHYQYKRCPFGLKTLPGFFQSLLNSILTGLQGSRCFVYIDDVVIFASSLEDHMDKISEVFDRFRDSNLKLNPEKCKFLQKEVLYLGHKCSLRGVEPDERIILSVKEFPAPTTIKKLQSFLGLANYYRKFINGFAKIANPLYGLLKGTDQIKKKLDWTLDCETSFQLLKSSLTTAPVLTYPDFDKDFSITCDASMEGLGAVLEQEGKVVAYASRTLLDTENRWSATELELNAIVFGWKTFKPYVLGRHVKVYTDHMPLKGIIKVKDTASRIVRLQQKLIDFDHEIIYKKGKENNCADFLSRNPINSSEIKSLQYTTEGQQSKNETLLRCLAVTRRQAKQDKKEIETTVVPFKSTNNENIEENEEDWEELEGLRECSLNGSGRQIITDGKEKITILKDYHDSIFGGHFGSAKTYARIKRKFYWKGMKQFISSYIEKCVECQRNKVGRATRMHLCETDLSKKPFDKIYIDMVGPLPMSASGNKHILSMVDDLTRFVEFAAVPDQTANTVAKALYEQILCRYSLPKVIISDNGTNFLSEVFKELGKLLKIDRRQISPFSPQGNLVERQHSTLANYLRCFAENDPTNWDTYLRTAAHAYNNTPHLSTGFAPMELLFGFTSEIPINLKRKPEPLYNHDSYYHELRYKLQSSFNIAKEKLGNAKSKSKQYYDKHANPKKFHKQQFVFMKNTNRLHKFSSHWVGPYEIIETHGPLNVTIKIGHKLKKVHVNRLKPFTVVE